MVFVTVLHGILLFCMVLNRLHGVVQLIWRAGELPHLVHLVILMERLSQYSWDLGRGMLPVPVYSAAGGEEGAGPAVL